MKKELFVTWRLIISICIAAKRCQDNTRVPSPYPRRVSDFNAIEVVKWDSRCHRQQEKSFDSESVIRTEDGYLKLAIDRVQTIEHEVGEERCTFHTPLLTIVCYSMLNID